MFAQMRKILPQLPWVKDLYIQPKSLDHVKHIETERRCISLNRVVNESMRKTVTSIKARYGDDAFEGMSGFIDKQLNEQGMF